MIVHTAAMNTGIALLLTSDCPLQLDTVRSLNSQSSLRTLE